MRALRQSRCLKHSILLATPGLLRDEDGDLRVLNVSQSRPCVAHLPGRGRPWGAGGADRPAAAWVLRIGNRRGVPERAGVEGWRGWRRRGVDVGQGAGQRRDQQGRRGNGGRTASHDKAQSSGGKGEKRKSQLVFRNAPAEETDDDNAAIKNSEQERYLSEAFWGMPSAEERDGLAVV